jgi:hypothetical protein
LQLPNSDDEIAPELGYIVTSTTHMLRARKIVIDRGRVAHHRHCATALSIAFMTFSLFRDVLKQAGEDVLDTTVPGNSGSSSYGKSVKKKTEHEIDPFSDW